METKEKLSKEYFSQLRKILKSESNSYNMIITINQWAVPAITYEFGIIKLLFPRVFLKWDSSRRESSVIHKAETYVNDIGLEFVDIVELNKGECKTRVKNSMTLKGNATLTNMPMHGQHHRLLQEEHID